ncbi:hypothetical protein MKX01_005700 [Papaver californicum]|nr:hypothetical protein MKX01_005700 [Papaver californicum]
MGGGGRGDGHSTTYKGLTMHQPKQWHTVTGKGMCALMWVVKIRLKGWDVEALQNCFDQLILGLSKVTYTTLVTDLPNFSVFKFFLLSDQ